MNKGKQGVKIELYDTTLRDGAQGPGIKFSVDDQLRVIQALDDLGVHYIEAGQPASNPKAEQIFVKVREIKLKNSKVVAFGSTRHPRVRADEDPNLNALLRAETEIVTIFAKSSSLHVEEVLGISLNDNLKLIEDSISFLKKHGRKVFLDAEHFFDGYDLNSEYALQTLEVAVESGADLLVLCDTNGGHLPYQIEKITRIVADKFPGILLGIHTHNDTGCAVANSISAVIGGARHVQGTINGYGERTGNANLCTLIPNLQIKMGYELITSEQMSKLTHVSHLVAELANLTPRDWDPYVGKDAFTHKAGMHADAVRKTKVSYEHIDPSLVGNTTHISVSELSGRANLIQKAQDLGITLEKDSPHIKKLLQRIKQLEHEGYEFEGADASLELLMLKTIGVYKPPFHVVSFHARVNQWAMDRPAESEATVKILLPDKSIAHTVAEGNGPVDALNNALRKALEPYFPQLRSVHLDDYKVRILDAQKATKAVTRVLIESSDENRQWCTVGVSENIITASFTALIDSIEYKLLKCPAGNTPKNE
ncbi:MAG: citramalate synthase [Candidatus Hydrogenedentes bacterium]|nr:citramalate synthase [Candidatus Hydrogenedentota bacterium]